MSDEEELDENNNDNFHGKPSYNLSQMHFHSETKLHASLGSYTKTYNTHPVDDFKMVPFDKLTMKKLQKRYFQVKMIKDFIKNL